MTEIYKTLLWTLTLFGSVAVVIYAYFFLDGDEDPKIIDREDAEFNRRRTLDDVKSRRKIVVLLKKGDGDRRSQMMMIKEFIDSKTVDSLINQTIKPVEISVAKDEFEPSNDHRVSVHVKNALPIREMDSNVLFVVAINGKTYDKLFIERSIDNFVTSNRRSFIKMKNIL